MPGPTTTDSPRRPRSGRSGVASGPDVLLVTKLHVVAVPGRPHPETVERPPGRYLTLTSLPASRRCQARQGQKARQPPPRQARRGQPNRGRRDRGTPARPDSLARYPRPIRRRHRRAPPRPAALSCEVAGRGRFHPDAHLRVTPRAAPAPTVSRRTSPSHDRSLPYQTRTWRLAKEMTMHPCVMKELVRQRERELRRSAPLLGSHVRRERAWLRRMGRRAGRAIAQVGGQCPRWPSGHRRRRHQLRPCRRRGGGCRAGPDVAVGPGEHLRRRASRRASVGTSVLSGRGRTSTGRDQPGPREPWARGADNRHARTRLAWSPRYPSWQEGFRLMLSTAAVRDVIQ